MVKIIIISSFLDYARGTCSAEIMFDYVSKITTVAQKVLLSLNFFVVMSFEFEHD